MQPSLHAHRSAWRRCAHGRAIGLPVAPLEPPSPLGRPAGGSPLPPVVLLRLAKKQISVESRPVRQELERRTPLDQRGVRRHNLGLVMRHVAQHGPRSRARIATETGLNKTTVSSLVAELI